MSSINPEPLILAFVKDLMFTARIAKAAEHVGYRVKWFESASDVGDVDPDPMPELPGELLRGQEGKLFELVAMWQPALMLFDLNNSAIPWFDWIAALKSAAATRRIPIMCFGPHEDVETMRRARSAGADAVLARSRFSADMPALFQQFARIPDREALRSACGEPLSGLAKAGINLINQRAFYPAHDKLEEAWMKDEGPGRDLYRAMLQVGIAYYQIEKGNYRGAIKMLLRVQQWLDPLPDVCRTVDVAGLRADARRVYRALVELGPQRVSEFDRELFNPIVTV